ncbi:MAG: exodeoxyribonuclease V subunit gamma [Gammaproteobacteria bacterium]|nr:exodeoxyribonuclease V subunit gamma [Gammaproteobacteria bacterium]MBL7000165.1 exodeoxyribonuclease V subunit gamma [Gammaproteobacteria bacterium]
MLYIHHSNRLNRLTEILQQQLGYQLSAVLSPAQILVQNPGMKRWLQQQISRSSGIAANLNFPLPSRFIWDVFLSQFNDLQDLSAYDGEVLRWRLMALFRQHQDATPLSILQAYMSQDESGLARFQLAEKMAGLYDQYLVYRPDMISNWEQGKTGDSSTEQWQAYLWSLIRQHITQPHRAELIKRLIQHIADGKADYSSLPQQLYVFGITAMSPLYMEVLAALGQHIEVHIFNLNPCEHYWGDIKTKKEQLRQGNQANSENELLASLGKQGRDFIDQFYDTAYDYQDNPQFEPIEADSLLHSLQQDVLQLSLENEEVVNQDDGSIRIVNCYSELRELQVLQDQLLELLQQDSSLQAHDIVVMCPDINTLAPYIEAVFGQQPEHKKIPFSISDQNTLATTPAVQAVLDWINLSSSRISANEVLGWLEIPALQRAYALDTSSVECIRHWVKSSHIHWGLDRAHKQRLGLGQNQQNSWLHGIGRLLTSYLMNETVSVFEQHVAAESLISNAEYQALGQLQKFLDDLDRLTQQLSRDMNLAEWQQQINRIMDTLLLLNDDEEWLLKPVRETLAAWQLQASHAGYSEALSANLIHYLLKAEISQGNTQHHYLTGGINFCNLIPMRTLPFRVVCLIGMGDEHFPRAEIPLQLDLISMYPKKGDRSRREDDRYMFLQSLLSAGDIFYLSFVGQNKKDDSTLEPSVVVSELRDYIRQNTGVQIAIQKTPLHAFSAKNFERGSFSEQWQLSHTLQTLTAFNQPIAVADIDKEISLDQLISFYKNPAKYFIQNRLNMSLQDYSETIDDDEVFALDALQRYQINSQLLSDLLIDQKISAEKYLYAGSLAQQNSGQIQFDDLQNQTTELYSELINHQHYNGLHYFDAAIRLNEYGLKGRVASFSQQGLLHLSQSSIKGKYVFSYWIQHCFLCATTDIAFSEFLIKDKSYKWYGFCRLETEQARQYLQQLIDGYIEGQRQLQSFYPDTAFVYETSKAKKGAESARQDIKRLWQDDEYSFFNEPKDIYIQTSLKNSGYSGEYLSQEFFDLSARYMAVALDYWDEIK